MAEGRGDRSVCVGPRRHTFFGEFGSAFFSPSCGHETVSGAMPGVYSQQLPPVLMSGSYQAQALRIGAMRRFVWPALGAIVVSPNRSWHGVKRHFGVGIYFSIWRSYLDELLQVPQRKRSACADFTHPFRHPNTLREAERPYRIVVPMGCAIGLFSLSWND